MSPFTGDDEVMRRAGWIAGRSWIMTLGDFVVGRSIASARSSRALMLARRCVHEFQSLPAGERTRCELIVWAAALAGHIVLAALLPASARPMLSVTAVALLAVGMTVSMSTQRRVGEQEVLEPDRVTQRPV